MVLSPATKLRRHGVRKLFHNAHSGKIEEYLRPQLHPTIAAFILTTITLKNAALLARVGTILMDWGLSATILPP
jgi:hypothetical protein